MGRVRSEENYDFLSFYANKVKKGTFSGHMKKWQLRQVQLSRGRNTLSWVYEKDSGDSKNGDGAWLANIKLVSGKCSIPNCLKKGWSYWAIGSSKVSNVPSAKACQRLCQRNKKCQVFSYLTLKDAKNRPANKDCYIIFAHNGLASKTLKGATSGPRFCD